MWSGACRMAHLENEREGCQIQERWEEQRGGTGRDGRGVSVVESGAFGHLLDVLETQYQGLLSSPEGRFQGPPRKL